MFQPDPSTLEVFLLSPDRNSHWYPQSNFLSFDLLDNEEEPVPLKKICSFPFGSPSSVDDPIDKTFLDFFSSEPVVPHDHILNNQNTYDDPSLSTQNTLNSPTMALPVLTSNYKPPSKKQRKPRERKNRETIDFIASADSEDPDAKKEKKRNSAAKNYVGILTRAFAKEYLRTSTEVYRSHLNVLLRANQEIDPSKYVDIVQKVNDYIRKEFEGKIYRDKNDPDKEVNYSKIKTKKELQSVLFEEKGDTSRRLLMKRLVRDLIDFFFEEENFIKWLEARCESKADGRRFFFKNRKELQATFRNPSKRTKFKE